jgi:hypothetical protein
VKPDAVPDVGTVDNAGPRMVGDEPALELLLLPDNVPCEGGGVVAVVLDVGDLLDGGLVVGAVVCVAGVLGVAVVDLAAAAWVVELELEAHEVEEAFGCVFAGALLLDVGGSFLEALLLGSALTLVLVPSPGLELPLPVSGLVGVTSGVGVGDGLGALDEAAGLGFTEADADELVFAADVDETDPADWADVHDDAASAGAVVNPPVVLPFRVPPPPPVDWPAGGGLVWPAVEFGEVRPVATAIPWRSGGMAARRTPTANMAMPTASAGRSIASRQSLGRCGARCECLDPAPDAGGEACPPGTACPRPTRPARNPAMARRKAANRGNLAVA